MKSFGEWLHSNPTQMDFKAAETPAQNAEKQALQAEVNILRGLVIDFFSDLGWTHSDGYIFRCCRCEDWRPLEDLLYYDPDGMYCGGSPHCCP